MIDFEIDWSLDFENCIPSVETDEAVSISRSLQYSSEVMSGKCLDSVTTFDNSAFENFEQAIET